MDTVVIHDAATGETVERPMTPDEEAQREADTAALAARQADDAAVATAKIAARDSAIARFKGLGFTDEEIGALVLP